MAKKIQQTSEVSMNVMDTQLRKVEGEKLPIEQMPLTSIRDYRLYNEEAAKLNKKLGVCRYPLKQCPIELHPKQRIVFRRNDQPSNPLDVHISNHLIHFEEKLIPGKTYDLPECVVHYLAEKGNPVWKWVENPDGSKETRVANKEPRFSITSVYRE